MSTTTSAEPGKECCELHQPALVCCLHLSFCVIDLTIATVDRWIGDTICNLALCIYYIQCLYSCLQLPDQHPESSHCLKLMTDDDKQFDCASCNRYSMAFLLLATADKQLYSVTCNQPVNCKEGFWSIWRFLAGAYSTF